MQQQSPDLLQKIVDEHCHPQRKHRREMQNKWRLHDENLTRQLQS